ncbi:hypothetical protein [Bradyrhizobium stylosanthis]|uniref:Uncharacterized protein n=1 Tax=Bradyrhizobium stylosanthis TaxID=1803665 RepID=A0A560E565_9BRAD|nr:hypothetical protein [Bradyrhizobium stylosanthis]TWB04497.1 hypothetical protein FBZ96_102973 [Bradyrhizobium stylosanthis]
MASVVELQQGFTAVELMVQERAQKNILRILARQKAEDEAFGRNTTRLVGHERTNGFLLAFLAADLLAAVVMAITHWVIPTLSWLASFIPTWIAFFILVAAAIYMTRSGWLVRDKWRSPYYPVVEMAVGLSISVVGALNAGFSGVGILAFLGGVRVLIDGYKRSLEFGSQELLNRYEVRFRYFIRRYKKFLRAFDHALRPRLDPSEFDHLGRRMVTLLPGQTLEQVWRSNLFR